MNILQKIFGKKKPASAAAPDERTRLIQETTDKLWKVLEDSLQFYNSVACQCAFPRFHQYTRIDCTDTRSSFYMSETEGFIHYSRSLFDIVETEKITDAYNAIYTCKKCGSTYDYGWSDFSISVDRAFLKPRQILVPQIGANPIDPIPFVVGLFGHRLPDRNLFEKIGLEQYAKYLVELKNKQ
jgi:hypothetical protein